MGERERKTRDPGSRHPGAVATLPSFWQNTSLSRRIPVPRAPSFFMAIAAGFSTRESLQHLPHKISSPPRSVIPPLFPPPWPPSQRQCYRLNSGDVTSSDVGRSSNFISSRYDSHYSSAIDYPCPKVISRKMNFPVGQDKFLSGVYNGNNKSCRKARKI